MRVSTQGMNTQILGQAMRVQNSYAAALDQQASGQKSASLSGLDGQAGVVTSLKSDISRSELLGTQAENAISRNEVAYGTVGSIADIVENTRVAIAAAMDGTITDLSTVKSAAENALDSIAVLLNTTYSDGYLFSGTTSNIPPVNLDDVDYDGTAGAADTDYYQGSSTLPSVMVGGNSSIAFGVTADAEAFEETLRALSQLATMDTATAGTSDLKDAYDLLSSATDKLGLIQENLSRQSQMLENVVDSQTEFQIYANEALESLTTVDVAEASAKVSQQEVLLQASFSALSSLTSISILDYM